MPKLLLPLLASLLLLIGQPANASDINKGIQEAYQYLSSNTLFKQDDELLDIQKMEAHLKFISFVIENYELSLEYQVILREVRGFSLSEINLQRLREQDIIDISQSEMALQDLLFANDHVQFTSVKDHLFEAGHIARHLLESPDLSTQYWEQCAKNQHAGCMNILATRRFTGASGIAVNIDESVKWHKATFNTGYKFNCAGIYSAKKLAQLSYFISGLNTGFSWQEWLEKASKIYMQLYTERPEMKCNMEWSLAKGYVFSTNEETNNDTFIEDAIAFTENDNYRSLFKLMLSGEDLSNAQSIITNFKYEAMRCEATLDTIILARNRKDYTAFQHLKNYMTTLQSDECQWPLAIIDRLKTDGKWEIE